ncbi:copper amine oxidase N-terminal domain-containing protein [Bacillus solimangrovi]|nr:copper amine oxidase N-terminal domain-containing protein [Bacillus solimangrovi]
MSLRKVFFGVFLSIFLFITSSTTYAEEINLKIDGVAIPSDVKSEIKKGRTMVPIRVISENLGAIVDWSDSKVTLTKGDMKVILDLKSTTAEKNGEQIRLDVKPYKKNDRIMVPLRFIAETFGSEVSFSNYTVTIDTEPLYIDGVQVKAFRYEFWMTMGSKVQQSEGNAFNTAFYDIFMENKGVEVEAPEDDLIEAGIDSPLSYSSGSQYDFLDQEGNSIKRFKIYYLSINVPNELGEGYPEYLLYDAVGDKWYTFNGNAEESIWQLIDTATRNGFMKTISNTVV